MWTNFVRVVWVILLSAGILAFPVITGAAPQGLPHRSRPQFVVFLVDRSESMKAFQPPETTLAVVLHILDVIKLSKQPVQLAAITFGGDGVRLIGDASGAPTAALATLRRDLIANWPESAGGTPMDEGFEKLVQFLSKLPRDADVTIVLIGDGQPSSGRLRGEDFPEIARDIELLRKRVLDEHKSRPAIAQEKLNDLEDELRLPTSKLFQSLYLRQLSQEFVKTLQHAGALKKRSVRFVTVDFANMQPLEDIHRAAGGVADDLLRIKPNEVIAGLHQRQIVALPNVVQLPTQTLAADDQKFDRTITVPLESIGEAALIPVEFQPAIERFDERCRLTASVGGVDYAFTTNGQQPEATLTHDGEKNIAVATLALDSLPPNPSVTIRFESPAAAQHVPACKVYSLLRLREDLQIEFRPTFAAAESVAPFRIAPAQPTKWTCGIRIKDQPQPYPLKGVEAVLIERRTQQQVRVELTPNSQVPGTFLSAESHIPQGDYDVELHFQLVSGASFQTRLAGHIFSAESNELVLIDIPIAVSGASNQASLTASHLDFGQLGDIVTQRTIEVTFRSENLAYPLTVIPEFSLADHDGNVPQQAWIRSTPGKVTLPPGQPIKVRFTLALPKHVDGSIRDGLFEGQVLLKHSETGQALAVKRFQKIEGVPDDAAVDRITFELKRPDLFPQMPRAFRNRIVASADGKRLGTLRVDVATPFGRGVWLTVRHDSEQARTITVLLSGGVLGPSGRIEPSVRLVPAKDSSATQEIMVGHKGVWKFQFEIDGNSPVTKATAGLDLTGDGFAPQHIDIQILQRQPLFGPWFQFILWCCAAVLAVKLISRWTARRTERLFTTDSEWIVTEEKPLPGYFRVLPSRGGVCQIEMEQPVSWQLANERTPRRLEAQRSTRLTPDTITEDKPVHFQVAGVVDAPVCEIQECRVDAETGTELRVVVRDGSRYDEEVDRLTTKIQRGLIIGMFVVVTAANFNRPFVIEAAQWLVDLVSFP